MAGCVNSPQESDVFEFNLRSPFGIADTTRRVSDAPASESTTLPPPRRRRYWVENRVPRQRRSSIAPEASLRPAWYEPGGIQPTGLL